LELKYTSDIVVGKPSCSQMPEYKTFDKKQPLQQKGATVWVGNIEPFMDEVYLTRAFGDFGQVSNVKICRDGMNHSKYQFTGYAFVEFASKHSAEKLISTCQGRMFVSKEDGKSFRLNWASHGVNDNGVKFGIGPEEEAASVFVGNLDMTVGDADLFKFFQSKFPSVTSAKVVRENQCGLSKGYGFVRMRDTQDLERILDTMQGKYLGSKPMNVKHGQSRKEARSQEQNQVPPSWPPPPPPPPVWPTAAFDGMPLQQLQRPPAITNMTTAQAQLQTWQMLGGIQEMKAESCTASPSSDPSWVEHFQALLQNPIFVNAFEEELRKSGSPCISSDAVMQDRDTTGSFRLSPILHDQPDMWGKMDCVDEANEDFIMSLETQ